MNTYFLMLFMLIGISNIKAISEERIYEEFKVKDSDLVEVEIKSQIELVEKLLLNEIQDRKLYLENLGWLHLRAAFSDKYILSAVPDSILKHKHPDYIEKLRKRATASDPFTFKWIDFNKQIKSKAEIEKAKSYYLSLKDRKGFQVTKKELGLALCYDFLEEKDKAMDLYLIDLGKTYNKMKNNDLVLLGRGESYLLIADRVLRFNKSWKSESEKKELEKKIAYVKEKYEEVKKKGVMLPYNDIIE